MMRSISFVLTVLASLAFAALARAQQAAHPLAALTAGEIEQAVGLLKKAGHADEATLYPYIGLQQAPKAQILAWKRGEPFTRAARVTLRRAGKTAVAVVDLSAGQVVSHDVVPGAQPSIMEGEWARAQELTKADATWRAAMAKRGLDDIDDIDCKAVAPGHFPGAITATRRILNVICFDIAGRAHRSHNKPIAGVMAVVDVDADKVIEVIDTGIVKPPATGPRKRGKYREPLKPVLNFSPQGPNYTVRPGWTVDWQNWSFQVRIDRRVGPVISLVRFTHKDKQRLIAYQMSLSEIAVPYMDPEPTWAFRSFMDSGEYGAGTLVSTLLPGRDCPLQATYITAGIPSDKGAMFEVERALCIFERNLGQPVWRHGPKTAAAPLTRPTVELVVRMITTVGNYDYAIDWVFSLNGNIQTRIGSAGYIALKTVEAAKVDRNKPDPSLGTGTLVAPGRVAVYHDHYFSLRLDLDIEGQNNTLVREVVTPRRLEKGSPRRGVWGIVPEPVKTEGPVRPGVYPEVWRVINPNVETALGHAPGIHIMPHGRTVSLLPPDDPLQARAEFSSNDLWVTAYDAKERFAAGDFVNQSKGGEGLPAYVADREKVENTDLVIWYTLGFHHVTRVEDYPIMPTMWMHLTLRPFNMLDRNPAADLAPDFKHAQ